MRHEPNLHDIWIEQRRQVVEEWSEIGLHVDVVLLHWSLHAVDQWLEAVDEVDRIGRSAIVDVDHASSIAGSDDVDVLQVIEHATDNRVDPLKRSINTGIETLDVDVIVDKVLSNRISLKSNIARLQQVADDRHVLNVMLFV